MVGKVTNGQVEKSISKKINNSDTEGNIINEIIASINEIMDEDVTGIGFGAPSLIDVKNGIVYNVQKIKSWREVHIKEILEDTFHIPVYVNNDANCFAAGEYYFGKGRNTKNLTGLILGAGVGAGIIFQGHLYSGSNCGAGEFGYLPYREHNLEYYLCDAYFDIKYGMTFDSLFARAKKQDKVALAIFEQYGFDLGKAIQMILYSVDPELIVIGGSISKAFEYFEKAMWEKAKTFLHKHSLKSLRIEKSEQEDISILGAAALYLDGNNNMMIK